MSRISQFLLTTSLVFVAAFAEAAEYSVDTETPLVTGPADILGVAGAWTGISTGAAGISYNPAAIANRSGRQRKWLGGDATLSGRWVDNARLDVENTGTRREPDDSLFSGIFSGNLLLGRLGLSMQLTQNNWTLFRGEDVARREVEYLSTSANFGAGWAFHDGQVIVGTQLLSRGARFTDSMPDREPLQRASFSGAAGSVGILVRPEGRPYRIGAAFREETKLALDPVKEHVTPTSGPVMRDGVVPWQSSIGGAYMFGGKVNRFRGPAASPSAQRLRYLMVAADVVVTGPSRNSLGVQNFADGTDAKPGRRASIGARIGAESEVLTNRMRVAGGTYWEPARIAGRQGRAHLTGGASVRIFKLHWDYRLVGAFDVAEGYTNTTISVGIWH